MSGFLSGKIKQHICAALVGIMVASTPCAVFASSTVTQKQNELSNAQSEKKDLESTLSDLENMKEELENSRRDLSSYVTKLDADLSALQNKQAELEELSEAKAKEVKEIKKRLVQAKKDAAQQYVRMKERIRFMYEKSNFAYMELIFQAKSFSDMLNKATYIEQLSGYDRNMLEKYEETKRTIVELQKNLKEEQQVLDAALKETKTNASEMENLIGEKQEQIEAYDSDISNKEKAIKEYEDMIAAQDSLIKSLEAQVAAAQKAAQAVSSNRVYGGGVFSWPAPSYTRISDDYGWRTHPTLKVQQFHNGIDMAAPSGSAINAAADGEVVAASYSATMGNYIMIYHGSNMYTIYMHASSLAVSNGASVKKGQRIGSVGSTGRSTGPHLHFSVRVNGSYVSPWTYLNK